MTDSSMKSSPSTVDSGTTDGDYQATLNLEASPDAVFDALTTTSAISKWWVTATGTGTADGELVIWFGDSRMNTHVDEAERASRVRWTVHDCELEPAWEGTEMIFDLCPAPEGGTRVDFRHHGLTPQLECFEMCSSGWIQALGGLMNYLEPVHGNSSNQASS